MKTNIDINIKRGVKAASVVALALVALFPAANSSAYGPKRDTFTMAKPADHVQFNSITDNPFLEDERDFVRVSEYVEGQGYHWQDTIDIVPGKTYAVYLYYHNNAASNLNELGRGMATNARMYTQYPSVVTPGKKNKVYGEITADNATPTAVWDEAYFTTSSRETVSMRYIAGSAKIHSAGAVNGQLLGDKYLFNKPGHLLGYNKLIGNLPGCAEYSGYITYHLYAEQVGAKINKYVSTDGKNYVNKVKANPGDKLYYKVVFENTGTSDLTNVGFHDQLPKGVTLVPGTTKLVNGANPDGVIMTDVIGQNGILTGMYGPGATAEITYQVTVDKNIVEGQECGKTYQYINQMYVNHDAGELHDGAIVEVPYPCPDKPEEPVDPTPVPPEEPDVPPVEIDPEDPAELPKTGPVEIAMGVIAIVCIVTGFVYWYHSQREVLKAKSLVDGGLDRMKDSIADGDGKTQNANSEIKSEDSEKNTSA